MSEQLRRAIQIGVLYLKDIDWHFRVYLMLANPAEVVERAALFLNLEKKIRIIAAEYLSDEFKYLRTGFILAHYGRRGVTHSVWHWADWAGTWEYFCQAWYCYGRTLGDMVPLDRTEPVLCQHEIDIVMQAGLAFREIASRSANHDDLVREYRGWTASS
jgi:hypothetical protein